MIYFQLFISLNTAFAYWLVTHKEYRTKGLWWTLFTESMWMGLFTLMGAYGLLPISLLMAGITIKRLNETPR